MKANYARKVSEQAFNELVEAVEAGKSEKLTAYLKAIGRFHNYSVGNAMLIHFQCPKATHVAGFRTWQRLGRYVKKGEHGIAILAPIVRHKKALLADDEKDSEKKVLVAFKTAYVFDIGQTDGKALPEFSRVLGDPSDYTERLKEYIAGQGIKVEYSNNIGLAEGVSCGGVIKVKDGLTAAEIFSVLVHELAHEMFHKDKDSKLKSKKIKETEAEAVAFVVCQGIGLDVNTAGSDYIQLYDGDKKTLLQSLERIQQTAAEILTVITTDNNSECETVGRGACTAAAA
jgi:antirestriction protein ArdC